jgi:hypothetical protein
MAGKQKIIRRTTSGELPRTRPCGCVFYGVDQDPTFPCRDATALQSSNRLAEMLAAAAPNDPFFAKLTSLTRAALLRHYGASVPTIEQVPSTEELSPSCAERLFVETSFKTPLP